MVAGEQRKIALEFLGRTADRNDVSTTIAQRVSPRELALRSLDQLPPFSPVMNHLIASLADDDVSFAKLAGVIERDTVLSGNVLRLVNSALYGRRGTVSSVRAAVSILGLAKLRNLLLGLSVAQMWAKVKTPAGWSMARFNDHAVATGLLADGIVQKTRVDYPEGAFVAGLLHDLGRLMIAISLPAEFEQISKMREEEGRRLEECEMEVLEVTHSELSAAALVRWNLPAQIQKAVLYHHQPQHDPARHAGAALPLSRALGVANELASALGHAITAEEAEKARAVSVVLEELGLAEKEEEIVTSFVSELKAIQQTM
jgi:HD-like signal output (HDOD) protein